MRGIHCGEEEITVSQWITPACAGNTHRHHETESAPEDHPRLCGEYCLSLPLLMCLKGSPPPVRGIPAFPAILPLAFRITPACAGNTIIKSVSPSQVQDHPRLCGEYYLKESSHVVMAGSPPPVRGILLTFPLLYRAARITPACAGNTTSRLLSIFLS